MILADSGDPDQTPHSTAYDLVLHCLLMSHKMMLGFNGLVSSWVSFLKYLIDTILLSTQSVWFFLKKMRKIDFQLCTLTGRLKSMYSHHVIKTLLLTCQMKQR